jgi:FkbM family methyltransferase
VLFKNESKYKKNFKKTYQTFSLFFGMQRDRRGIGIIHTPFIRKSYLKRSFSQQGEDLTVDRIWTRVLKNEFNKKGVYVDIGSYHLIEHSVTYLAYLRGWSGLVVDASPKSCDLHGKYRPKDKIVNAVVGGEDIESVDFYFHKFDELSLINTKYPNDKSEYIKTSLPQKNINSILMSTGIEKIDLLNIDIEGAELEVLEVLDFDKYQPKIVAVEIHGNNIEYGLKTEVAKILLSKKYILVGVNVITYFFLKKYD